MAVYMNGNKIAEFRGDIYLEGEDVVVNFQDGSPQGVVNTISDLPLEGATGIYVVQDNGYWYWWDGAEWTQGGVYQASESDAANVTYDNSISGLDAQNVQEAIDDLFVVYGGEAHPVLEVGENLTEQELKTYYLYDSDDEVLNLIKRKVKLFTIWDETGRRNDNYGTFIFANYNEWGGEKTYEYNYITNDITTTIKIIEYADDTYDYIPTDLEEDRKHKVLKKINARLDALEGAVYTPIQSNDTFRERVTAEGETIVNGAYALVNKIGGKTIKISQKVGELPATITKNGVTFTNNSDGSIKINGTATGNNAVFQLNDINAIQGHKYLLCGSAVSPNGYLRLYSSGLSANDTGNGQIETCTANITTKPYIVVLENVSVNNIRITPQLFDLTAMGLDNITSKAEFYSIVGDRYYEIGDYLLHANATKLESYNSNLFSGNSWRLGYGIMDDGISEVTYSRYSYCEDYIRVLPNTQHIYSQYLTAGLYSYRVFYYDIDNRYIDKSNELNFSQTFTTPSDCHYVRLQINSIELPVLPTRCMLNVGNTAQPYIPFNSVSLNIPAFNQYGLNDTLYNYIDYENKKYVQKLMLVKLKDLSWSYNSGSAYFYTDISNMAITPTITTNVKYIECNKYIALIGARDSEALVDKAILKYASSNARIMLKDTSYTSAASLVASFTDNDYLLYELATPIESDITLTTDKYLAYNQGLEEFDSDVALVTEIVYLATNGGN